MERPLSCEHRSFINGEYYYSFYDPNDNYMDVLETGALKYSKLIWVELMIPNYGKISGMVIRSKMRNIKRRNLEYEFIGTIYKINDIIHHIEYSTQKIQTLVEEKKASYEKILNFE